MTINQCGVTNYVTTRSVLSAVSKDDPYIHLTKTMEVLRVHLFDIVTQYRAIFSEEQLLVMPTMANINR